MRIAMVLPQSATGVGGVEAVALRLAEQFVHCGHTVDALVHAPASGPSEIQHGPVCIRRFAAHGAPVAPGLATYLVRKARDYDIVHAHSYHALPVLAALLARPRALVFTPHYHGAGHTVLRQVLLRAYRPVGYRLLRAVDAVVCVSVSEALLLQRHFGNTVQVRRIIPHGVDAGAITAAAPFPGDKALLLSVGRLERYKGVARLVRALPCLDSRFSLAIAGAGPEEPALRSLVAGLSLQHRVRFLGVLDQATLHRWLRTAAVLVTLSRLEAYGLVVVEALAAGARVVAADIPAMREHKGRPYGQGITLVPAGAGAEAIAAAVCRAAAGSRFSCLEHLPSWESAAVATLQLYQELGAR